jgi:hypothetical protein
MRKETENAVAQLLSETGHALAVADFDDIAALDKLAGDLATDSEDLDIKPVWVGGVQVQPLTLYRAAWLGWAREWAGDDEALVVGSIGLVLTATCHATLADVHDTDTLRGAVVRWMRSTPWTPAQFRRATEMRLQPADGTEHKGDGTGGIVAFLSAEYGASPDYWLYEADAAIIASLLAEWVKKQEAQAEGMRRASKGRATVAPVATPKFRAARLFREKCEEIKAKWQSKT